MSAARPTSDRTSARGPADNPAAAPELTGVPLRVVVVDDQMLVRSGFSMILSIESDIDVVGEASDGRAAIELVGRLHPDLVLMDVQMPVMDGIEATREIVRRDLAKVIILTTFDRDDYLIDALRAGASGFLLKNSEPERLVDAVRIVGSGHALLAPEVTRRVIERMTGNTTTSDADRRAVTDADVPAPGGSRAGAGSPAYRKHDRALQQLTQREHEVLILVARGLSNAEIATELFVGEATVKTHVSNCLAKLQLRDRVQAVVLAHEAGLIPAGD